jgi:VanZ family protein
MVKAVAPSVKNRKRNVPEETIRAKPGGCRCPDETVERSGDRPRPAHPALGAVRVVCGIYSVLLVVLLLVPDPKALLGLEDSGVGPAERGVHFVAFFGLGVLVLLSRLRLRAVTLAGLLIASALGLETLQLLVPERTVELPDFAENLLGLAVGATLWAVALRRRTPQPGG